MGHVRINAELRGEQKLALSEAISVEIRCVGFINGGDAIIRIAQDKVMITRDTVSFAYVGSIIDWMEAARDMIPIGEKR